MTNLPKAQSALPPSLAERAEHREWIGGRCATLLAHYWRADDPVELTAALGQDWADVLEGLPKEAIKIAVVRWMRDEPDRKPKPGNIYALARESMPPIRVVPRHIPEPEKPPRVSAERAQEIMRDAGFRPKKFGGDE